MASSGPKRLTPPSPPAHFATLDLSTVSPSRLEVFRLSHERYASPLFFLRGGIYRFDSSTAAWGVCYLGHTLETAFLEVFADAIRTQEIDYSDLHAILAWKVALPSDLNVLKLEGTTLPKIKATVQSFVSRYSISQAWGRAFMSHPANLDGVIYQGRRSAGECLALFGDTDPAKGRLHQPLLRPTKLGRVTEWSHFYRFIDQTGARVTHLPSKRPRVTW